MDAPDTEVHCLARLEFWGLICRRVLGHSQEHFGDNGEHHTGYWGQGVVHVQRVEILVLSEAGGH